jgi:hypothetical protein
VLSSDLDAAAAALSEIGSGVTPEDIARVNEILGIDPDDTDLSPSEIADAVSRLRSTEPR